MPNPPSDAAKRCSDTIRLHILNGMEDKYAAIKLSDGSSDDVVYDTRRDAIRHQLHETQCMYIKIPADDMPPEHAERLLTIHRDLYDAGMHFIDPDGPELIIPDKLEDLSAAYSLLRSSRYA